MSERQNVMKPGVTFPNIKEKVRNIFEESREISQTS